MGGYYHLKLPENDQVAVNALKSYFAQYEHLQMVTGSRDVWFKHPEISTLEKLTEVIHQVNPNIECYLTNSVWLKRTFKTVFTD
jgi:hypothetical protein